jgi:Ca2+-binding EF-hand superfamily protein
MRRGGPISVALLGILGVLAPAGRAPAQTPAAPDAKAWVQDHDKNGDGKLDREEFHQAVIEAFFFRDANKDGYLTVAELGNASPGELRALERNGRIALQEYLNALHLDFDAIDTDKDGLLSVEEIIVYTRAGK